MRFPWPFLGLPIGIIFGIIGTHSYPHRHCVLKEHVGILDESIWRTQSGERCGEAYPLAGEEPVWHGFADAVGGPAGEFSSKDAAYKAVEWWCRP